MTELQRFLKEARSEIVALGKKKGFNFTEAEVNSLAHGQLLEEQLGSVSGGLYVRPLIINPQPPSPLPTPPIKI